MPNIIFTAGQLQTSDQLVGFTDAQEAEDIVAKFEEADTAITRLVGNRVTGVSAGQQSGTITITYSNGTTQTIDIGGVIGPTAHDLYAGWSNDDTVTVSEVEGGADSETNLVTLPSAVGSQYLFVWRSDTDGGDPTEVHIAGGGNSRNLFGSATNLTVSSVAGKLIISVNTQNATLLSGEQLRVV